MKSLPIKIEGKPGDEGKKLNQKEKKKTGMVKEGATSVVKTNEDTRTEFHSNVKYVFGSHLNKKIHQHPLEVTSMTSQAHSCKIEAKYKVFGQDDTTLQHERPWFVNMLERHEIG
jgi:hypothetical protein